MKIDLNFKKITAICFCFSIFSVLVFWWGIFLPVNSSDKAERVFEVRTGEGTGGIAYNLAKQDFIKGTLFFRIYAHSKGMAGNLQAGKYLLSSSMTIPEIVKKMAKGDIVKEKITIVEGWTLRDIAWCFEGKELFQAEEFFEVAGFPLVEYESSTELPRPMDFSSEFAFLKDKPRNISLEGYIFPDTYEITNNDDVEDIIRKTLANFDKKLTLELREEIERQKKSIFQIVTMASLIEKEVSLKEDKELVSGILWKRLESGMPLQVDATIVYILKTTNPEGVALRPYGARISIEETKIDSAYNTYKYPGLPLGPICNPGLESITVAIYPKESDYWYYLSKPDGETVFSRTYEEHSVAKEKYLR